MDHGTNFDFKDGKLKITMPYEELSTIAAHSLNYDVTEHQRTKSLTWALVKHVESQNLKFIYLILVNAVPFQWKVMYF